MRLLNLLWLMLFSGCSVIPVDDFEATAPYPTQFSALSKEHGCPDLRGKYGLTPNGLVFLKNEEKYAPLQVKDFQYIYLLNLYLINSSETKYQLPSTVPKEKLYFEILQPSDNQVVIKSVHFDGKWVTVKTYRGKNNEFSCDEGILYLSPTFEHGGGDGGSINRKTRISIARAIDGALIIYRQIGPWKVSIASASAHRMQHEYYSYKQVQ